MGLIPTYKSILTRTESSGPGWFRPSSPRSWPRCTFLSQRKQGASRSRTTCPGTDGTKGPVMQTGDITSCFRSFHWRVFLPAVGRSWAAPSGWGRDPSGTSERRSEASAAGEDRRQTWFLQRSREPAGTSLVTLVTDNKVVMRV